MTQLNLKTQNNLASSKEVNPVFARHETFHPRFGLSYVSFLVNLADFDVVK